MNAWVGVMAETMKLMGCDVDMGELYTKLYQKSLEGDADCGGVIVYNYLSGEPVTGFDEGRPVVVRSHDKPFTLANFLRSQLYGTMASLAAGMEILKKENVTIDRMMGHGGLFKTPVVGQKYMAAACNAPVTCRSTAGEGGPYGMALLAAYMANKDGASLEEYLNRHVFADAPSTTLAPDASDVAGFNTYIENYKRLLEVERKAVEVI
jgi:sugar (pentulose or hexulose) kinase